MIRSTSAVVAAALAVAMLAPGRDAAAQHSRLFPPREVGMLEGPDRESWQRPEQIMDALYIGEGSVVAEVGAAGGWFTIRLARRVGPNGAVFAEDIQPLMIQATEGRVRGEGLRNVKMVLGTPLDPRLPEGRARCRAVRGRLSRDRAADYAPPQPRHVAETHRPHRHRGIHEGRLGSRPRDGRTHRRRARHPRRGSRGAAARSGARPSFAISTCSMFGLPRR